MKYDKKHSVEQLALLQQYIVMFTILLGLPGVGLYLRKDRRYLMATILYLCIISLFIYMYNAGNKTFFPDITIT